MAILYFIKRYLQERRRRDRKRRANEEARSRQRREERIKEFLAGQERACFSWEGDQETNYVELSAWAECCDLERDHNGRTYFFEPNSNNLLLVVTPNHVYCDSKENAELALWVAMSQSGGKPIKINGPDDFKEEIFKAAQKMYDEYGLEPEIVGMPRPIQKDGKPAAMRSSRTEAAPESDDDGERWRPRM
jgi:hypothetical protein